jgi:hypothetical protein
MSKDYTKYFRFGTNAITGLERVEFIKVEGEIAYFKQVKGMGEKYVTTEFLNDQTMPVANTKKGILIEIFYEEKKKIKLKDNKEKEVNLTEYVFINFTNKTINSVTYHDVKEIVTSIEIDLYI